MADIANPPSNGEPTTEAGFAEKYMGLLDAEEAHPDADPEDEEQAPPADAVDEDQPAEDEEPPEPAPDSDDEEDDEPEAPASPTPKLYKVKVDGAEVEVTEQELTAGYSRQADYTRKTQALSAKEAAVLQEAEKYKATLEKLETFLESVTPKAPDWRKIAEEDPENFPVRFAEWQSNQQTLERVQAEKRATEERLMAAEQEKLSRTLEAERQKLLDVIPEWKDEGKRAKGMAEVVKFGTEFGLTKNELARITDHRAIKILHDAMMYQASKQKIVKPAPGTKRVAPVIAPGAAASVQKVNVAGQKAKARLAKTGDVDDFAAALIANGMV